jgi:hypothetical protein
MIGDQLSRAEAAARKLARKVLVTITCPGEPVLLVMNRAVLASDVEAMRSRTRLNFAMISAADFEAVIARLVSKSDRQQTFYTATYWALPQNKRSDLRALANHFLAEARKHIAFDAVVVGNTDYWQDEPLKEACREAGVPFVVLCRENYVVDYEKKLLSKRIKDAGFEFRGDAVAVASKVTQEVMGGTGAYQSRIVETTGWPRFDSWTEERASTVPDPGLITLIAYQQKTYLAPENFVDTLRSFVRAARSSGQPQRFCIKLKKISHLKGLMRITPFILLSGIKITAASPLDGILRRSAMVIGYNTTGILEAYLTRANVVVPWWGDAVRSSDSNLISGDNPDDRATSFFPQSPEEMERLIGLALQGALTLRGSDGQRLAQFRRFIHFDYYETASARFERLVRCLLPGSPSQTKPGDMA